MFSPETNSAAVAATQRYMQGLTDAELSQAIAAPSSLVGKLSGFTINHLRTRDEAVVLQVARDEQQSRRDAGSRRQATHAFWVSVVSVAIAAIALVVSIVK
jgi:hypothetical protein